MRHVMTSLCAAACAFILASAADAGTLIPVAPADGATTTNVFDVNDDLEIAGAYTDGAGIEHGFFGFLGSDYVTFDYGGTAIGTEARSINDAGYIVGFAPDASFADGPEFLRAPDGTLKTIKKTGTPLDGIAQGLTSHQISTGDYLDPVSATRKGYRGKNAKYQADVVPDVSATRVSARDINRHGAVAGFYVDGTGDHGFILTDGGTQTFDADASGTTTLEGLNDNGIATGQVVDEALNNHAFILDPATSTVTWIDVPGSTDQQAWGINKRGFVAVSTDIGSFVYCPFKPSRCPAGGFEIAERTTQAREGQRAGAPSHPRAARRGAAR